MKPRWHRGKNEQQTKELLANYTQSNLTRERLVEMLSDDMQTSLKEMRDAAKGVIPNLSEYYADELSKQRTLLSVIKLIKEN